MASDYNAILDLARLRLPGALDGVIQLELSRVLDDLCDKTNAWVEQVAFQSVAGQYSYEIYTVQGDPIRLMNVVDDLDPAVARPWDVFMNYPNVIQFRTAPSVAKTFYANFSIMPDDDFPVTVPTWFWSKYHSLILDGILGRMMSQIAKPYSSPANARIHTAAFNSGANQARVEMLRRYRFRGQGWMFPQGWAARKFSLGGGAVNVAPGGSTVADTSEITVIQLKRRLNESGLLWTIDALIPASPYAETNIIWNGQVTHKQDNLARFIQSSLSWSTAQTIALYTSAAALPGALPPATLDTAAPEVYIVQLKQQLNFLAQIEGVQVVIPGAPDPDVRVVWGGVASAYGDSLSLFIQSTLGYSNAQMLALYIDAFSQERAMPAISANDPDAPTLFTEQLKRQLNVDGVLATIAAVIPADVTDPANIAWTGGITYYGDALSNLVQTTLDYTAAQTQTLYYSAMQLTR